MKKLILIAIPLMMLTACDKKPKTIDYYSSNIKEARIVLESCKKTGNDSVDCYNAKKAVIAADANKHPVRAMELDSSPVTE